MTCELRHSGELPVCGASIAHQSGRPEVPRTQRRIALLAWPPLGALVGEHYPEVVRGGLVGPLGGMASLRLSSLINAARPKPTAH
eukprot:scaffold47222_cov72-Phaeocystis_antarctica.AAC.7